jgi:hypothetical protein
MHDPIRAGPLLLPISNVETLDASEPMPATPSLARVRGGKGARE